MRISAPGQSRLVLVTLVTLVTLYCLGVGAQEEDDMSDGGYYGDESEDLEDNSTMVYRRSVDGEEDDNNSVVYRRSADGRYEESETVLSSGLGDTAFSRIDLHHLRGRRAVKNTTFFLWGPKIPYRFDSSYPEEYVPGLKKALAYVDNRVCISHIDVTDEWTDLSDKEWPSKNGFDSNAYLMVRQGEKGCMAILGRSGHTEGGQVYNPCRGWYLNLHETLHTLGVVHTQRSPNRDKYIRLNDENIQPWWRKHFRKMSYSDTHYDFFDPMSPMLYGFKLHIENGLEGWFPIRDDLFELEGSSMAMGVIEELNKVYKCNEKYCGNSQTDCDLGFFALTFDKCQCICPEGQDPAENCQKHVDLQANQPPWPPAPATMFGPDCPDGFESGQLNLYWPKWGPRQFFKYGDEFEKADGAVVIPLCVKSTPTGADVDWSAWGEGAGFCIIKPLDVECGGGFSEGQVAMETTKASTTSGSVGDITITEDKTTIRFCCQNIDGQSLTLPANKPFVLSARKGKCPDVKGMRYTKNKLIFWHNAEKSGEHAFTVLPGQVHVDMCYYFPSKGGCSEMHHLSSSKRSVTITVPQKDGGREVNKRCQYDFRAPEGALLKVTFDPYDPEDNDLLYMKRDQQWLDWYRVRTKQYQILTVKNYLSMLYWSSWITGDFKGFTFTIEVMLAEESCYDVNNNGKEYAGGKSVSETFEACLPWWQAVGCSDFPWEHVFTYNLLDEDNNKCRNPGGDLLQPWCYTYVHHDSCKKRYCEICNYVDQRDFIPSCEARKSEDASFCTDGVGRTGCAKTCNLPLEKAPDTAPPECGEPKGPAGSTPAEDLEVMYEIGDHVDFTCGDVTHSTVCTPDGWTKMISSCDASSCEDNVPECESFAVMAPDFCSLATRATSFCRKTCGGCGEKGTCDVPTSGTYTSEATSAEVGSAVEFKCNDGLFHTGGNLKRLCTYGSKWLGSEPKCSASPGPLDVNLDFIRSRPDALEYSVGFLLDAEEYLVPFAGKISLWYYFCKQPGDLEFIVYRKDGSDKYKYVGSNAATCDAGIALRHFVPEAERISVQAGDAVGVHTLGFDTVAVNNCKGQVKLIKPLQATGPDAKALDFSKRGCFYPSVGYRVEP